MILKKFILLPTRHYLINLASHFEYFITNAIITENNSIITYDFVIFNKRKMNLKFAVSQKQ